jgi:NADPH2:quinone reductase
MRAVVVEKFGPFENAAVRDIPVPAVGADDVLVEIHAVAANFVDTLLIAGTYQFRPTPPFVPGKLPAGVVKTVGADVTTLKAGDRVLAIAEYGGYGEAVVVPASHCIRIPPAMSFTDAASMSSVYDTSLVALRDRAQFKPGESVLVVGATGGVGLASVQLVKALGGTALAGVGNPAKAHLALEAGADAIIDLSGADLKDKLRDQVYAANGGRGVDIVLDMLGGDYFDAAIRALAWRGRLVVIGFAAGRIPTLKVNYVLLKNISVSGIQISNYRTKAPEMTADCYAELFSLYEAGKIKSLPTTTMPMERFADALRALRDRTAQGRIVLVPQA